MENQVILTGYVARDKRIHKDYITDLFLYWNYPEKNEDDDYWDEWEGIPLAKSNFPNIKWEDKEPTEVEITIKEK